MHVHKCVMGATPKWVFCAWSLFCNAILSVLSSFAIYISEEERAGCTCCRVVVVVLCLFLTWVGLKSVTLAFPRHTH